MYDDTSLLKELKKEYDIKLLSSDDIIFVDELKLNILGPIRKYENENDNSLVIQTIIEERVYLFTADIEQAAELDLIAKYKDILKSDVVKVAHHGSNSSFSKEFLNYVKGDYYLISVKQNNKYGFPNNTNVLDKPNVYRTDEISTFKIYSRKKSFYIRKKLLLW